MNVFSEPNKYTKDSFGQPPDKNHLSGKGIINSSVVFQEKIHPPESSHEEKIFVFKQTLN